MSDRLRKTIGVLLLLISLLLIALPLGRTGVMREQRYRSGESGWFLKPIEPEENGGLRVNEANEEELASLPGIGETYADRIVTERRNNGPFYYPEDLEAVSGIGPQTLKRFRTQIDLTLFEGGNGDGIPGAVS